MGRRDLCDRIQSGVMVDALMPYIYIYFCRDSFQQKGTSPEKVNYDISPFSSKNFCGKKWINSYSIPIDKF